MKGTPAEPGLILLALQQIFMTIVLAPREFLLRASYMEIYNEKCRDLLNPDNNDELSIREDKEVSRTMCC